MDGKETGISDLVARLDRLERSNQRWRNACLIGLCAIVAIPALGAVLPNGVRNVVRAHRFELVDATGKTIGALINAAGRGVVPPEPVLVLSGDAGGSASLSGKALVITGQGSSSVVGAGGAGFVSADGTIVVAAKRDPDGKRTPAIRVMDGAGFELDLGVATLQTIGTGETKKTSAASIVMFGNDKNHKVIWRAPLP